jgi:hypothetical protein
MTEKTGTGTGPEFAASRLTLLGAVAGLANWGRLAIYLIFAVGGSWLWDYHFYGMRPPAPTTFSHYAWHFPWYFFLIWFVGVLGIKNKPPCKESTQ